MLRRHKPLLLSTSPGVLFLVRFNNSDQFQVTRSYSSHPFFGNVMHDILPMYACNMESSWWYTKLDADITRSHISPKAHSQIVWYLFTVNISLNTKVLHTLCIYVGLLQIVLCPADHGKPA